MAVVMVICDSEHAGDNGDENYGNHDGCGGDYDM